jgi:hypothetical protein
MYQEKSGNPAAKMGSRMIDFFRAKKAFLVCLNYCRHGFRLGKKCLVRIKSSFCQKYTKAALIIF